MSILQLSLPLSSCSPLVVGGNYQITKKSFPLLSHTSTSYHFKKSSVSTQENNSFRNPKLSHLRITCSAASEELNKSFDVVVKEKSVSVILLAGGKGKRMGASMPKQYLPLLGQPIALYSLYTFSRMPEVKEIIVVCDPSYQDIFEDAKENIHVDLKFALPGKERQDSVYSGLQEVDGSAQLVCIHDSARPLVLAEDVEKVLKDGLLIGAAVLGVPAKATIKEKNYPKQEENYQFIFPSMSSGSWINVPKEDAVFLKRSDDHMPKMADSKSFVVRTLDRKTLWEMQTPQVIKPELLKKGFELVKRENLEVTDDVSIVEYLKHPVYITEGSYTNIKVTTPDDLLLAERILNPNSAKSS